MYVRVDLVYLCLSNFILPFNRGITLKYIIRVGDIVTLPIEAVEPDVNRNEVLAENTTHFGPYFTRDKSNVFAILRLIMTSTPGWNVISKHAIRCNGRQSYMELKSHFQGSSYLDQMETQATTWMTRTYYHSDRSNFTWKTIFLLIWTHTNFIKKLVKRSQNL